MHVFFNNAYLKQFAAKHRRCEKEAAESIRRRRLEEQARIAAAIAAKAKLNQ